MGKAAPRLGRGIILIAAALTALALLGAPAASAGDLGVLAVHRRLDRSRLDRRERGDRIAQRLLLKLVAERIMLVVTQCGDGGARRLKAHIVPAEVLERAATLAEALGTHCRTRRTLAGEQA